MTAWIMTEDGRGFAHHGRYTSEDGAIQGLMKRVKGCFEVHSFGAEREPLEVTAEWLMANCREVELF